MDKRTNQQTTMQKGGKIPPNSTFSPPIWESNDSIVHLFVSIETVLVILILISNGLVLAAFIRNKRLRSTITNFYLLQLALADFVTGLFAILHITFQLKPSLIENVWGCLTRYTTMTVTCGVAMLSLLAISYDRFLAIAGPFYYRSKLCKKRVMIQVLIIDAIPFTLCVIIPIFWHGEVKEDSFCNMVDIYTYEYLAYIIIPVHIIITLLQIALYSLTLYLTNRRSKILKKLQPRAHMHPSWKRSFSYRGSAQLTKTGALVLAAFIICWAPFFITLVIQIYGHYTQNQDIEDYFLVVAYWIGLATFFLILLDCVLNPVILIWRLPMFKNELRRMFGRAPPDVGSSGSEVRSGDYRRRSINNPVKDKTDENNESQSDKNKTHPVSSNRQDGSQDQGQHEDQQEGQSSSQGQREDVSHSNYEFSNSHNVESHDKKENDCLSISSLQVDNIIIRTDNPNDNNDNQTCAQTSSAEILYTDSPSSCIQTISEQVDSIGKAKNKESTKTFYKDNSILGRTDSLLPREYSVNVLKRKIYVINHDLS